MDGVEDNECEVIKQLMVEGNEWNVIRQLAVNWLEWNGKHSKLALDMIDALVSIGNKKELVLYCSEHLSLLLNGPAFPFVELVCHVLLPAFQSVRRPVLFIQDSLPLLVRGVETLCDSSSGDDVELIAYIRARYVFVFHSITRLCEPETLSLSHFAMALAENVFIGLPVRISTDSQWMECSCCFLTACERAGLSITVPCSLSKGQGVLLSLYFHRDLHSTYFPQIVCADWLLDTYLVCISKLFGRY